MFLIYSNLAKYETCSCHYYFKIGYFIKSLGYGMSVILHNDEMIHDVF